MDLFKKTLSLAQKPSSMGFLQKKSSVSAGLKARNLIQLASQGSMHHMQLDLIAAALKSKKADFSKASGGKGKLDLYSRRASVGAFEHRVR